MKAVVIFILLVFWIGVSVASFCRKPLGGLEGTFQTKAFPDTPCQLYKKWEITVPPGKYVVLTFDSFDLGKWSCMYDVFVQARDGHNRYSNILESRCGKANEPFEVSSSGNKLTVEMYSGLRGRGELGFTARYRAVDLNDPGTPPSLVQCPYQVQVLSGQRSQLGCRVVGRPAPLIAWYKEGRLIQNSTSVIYPLQNDERGGIYSFRTQSTSTRISVDVQNCTKVCNCSTIRSFPFWIRINCKGKRLYTVPKDLPQGTRYLSLNGNYLPIIDSRAFQRVQYLQFLSIQSTGLANLTDDALNLYDLKHLEINYNTNFTVIKANAFKGIFKVEYLSLKGNSLRYIDKNAFQWVEGLQKLDLSSNKLTSLVRDHFFPLRMLTELNLRANLLYEVSVNLEKLERLDLSENQITELPRDSLLGSGNLQYLNLRSNGLRTMPVESLAQLYLLRDLDLSNNKLSSLPKGIFRDLLELRFLDLSENDLSQLPSEIFKDLTNLKTLYLYKNKLVEIAPDNFKGLGNLENLYLQDNLLKKMPPNTFEGLHKLEDLKLDSFSLCCYATKFLKQVNCEYPKTEKDTFSSCNRMIEAPGPRRCIWLLGLLAVLGNLAVVVWRLVRRDDHPVQTCLLTNLAVADFMMGIYLMIVAIKDEIWAGSYFEFDLTWRSGLLCKVAGAMSVLSSEVSVLMLTVITADRLISIIFTFSCRRLTLRATYVICAVVWIAGAVIAVVPTFDLPYFYNEDRDYGFYGRSSVCLPIQLSSERLAGWEYSMAVFVALNMSAFLFMLSAYIAIILKVYRSQRRVKAHGQAEVSSNLKRESALARRVFAIIMTDFSCWIPVIILSILAITGNFHDAEGLVYVWFAVFVLPVNSSVNPVLYTFSTPKVRSVMKRGFLYLFGCIRGKVISTSLKLSGRTNAISQEETEDQSIVSVGMVTLPPTENNMAPDADIGKTNAAIENDACCSPAHDVTT